MTQFARYVRAVVFSPVLWGLAVSFAFYYPIHTGSWTNPFVVRYFAGHWVEYVTTILFFIGLAALVLRGLELAAQRRDVEKPLLDAIPPTGQPVEHAGTLLTRLNKQTSGLEQTYIVRRLREALEYVQRKGSADTLDEQLRYLSDLDAGRMHAAYSLVRIIIWAVPILGFLGTVIGITDAVASLSPQALEQSLPGVTAGLGVAFDTTALSLGLSMVLMFGTYVGERYEGQLVGAVDDRASAELVGRFESTGSAADPDLTAVRRMAEVVIQATEKVVERQAALWQTTIDAAHKRWSQLTGAAGQQLETALAGAMGRNVKEHAAALAQAEAAVAEQSRRQWAQLQQALLQNAEAVTLQQRELVKQGDVMLQVIHATERVTKLETELNRNLEALAGAQNFEETVTSLAAAIQLLSVRLGQLPPEGARIELKAKNRTGQAA